MRRTLCTLLHRRQLAPETSPVVRLGLAVVRQGILDLEAVDELVRADAESFVGGWRLVVWCGVAQLSASRLRRLLVAAGGDGQHHPCPDTSTDVEGLRAAP